MDIDRVGRLYDCAEVTRVAMRSLAWGSLLFWIGVALAPLIVADPNLRISEFAGILLGPLLLSILIVVLTLAGFWPAHVMSRVGDMLLVLGGSRLVYNWCNSAQPGVAQ